MKDAGGLKLKFKAPPRPKAAAGAVPARESSTFDLSQNGVQLVPFAEHKEVERNPGGCMYHQFLQDRPFHKSDAVYADATTTSAESMHQTGFRNPLMLRSGDPNGLSTSHQTRQDVLAAALDIVNRDASSLMLWDTASQRFRESHQLGLEAGGSQFSLSSWLRFCESPPSTRPQGRFLGLEHLELSWPEYTPLLNALAVLSPSAPALSGSSSTSPHVSSASPNVCVPSVALGLRPPVVNRLDWLHQEDIWPRTHRSPTESDASDSPGPSAVAPANVYLWMGCQGSYVDFNFAPGGAATWCHVLRGERTYLLLPPSKDILQLFEGWHVARRSSLPAVNGATPSCPAVASRLERIPSVFSDPSSSPDCNSPMPPLPPSLGAGKPQASHPSFFPDLLIAKKVMRSIGGRVSLGSSEDAKGVEPMYPSLWTVRESETLLIPSGWLFAVYHSVDGVALGGYFLHGLSLNAQLVVANLQQRLGLCGHSCLPSTSVACGGFPLFRHIHWLAAVYYIDTLRGYRAKQNGAETTPAPNVLPHEMIGLGALADALRAWLSEYQRSHSVLLEPPVATPEYVVKELMHRVMHHMWTQPLGDGVAVKDGVQNERATQRGVDALKIARECAAFDYSTNGVSVTGAQLQQLGCRVGDASGSDHTGARTYTLPPAQHCEEPFLMSMSADGTDRNPPAPDVAAEKDTLSVPASDNKPTRRLRFVSSSSSSPSDAAATTFAATSLPSSPPIAGNQEDAVSGQPPHKKKARKRMKRSDFFASATADCASETRQGGDATAGAPVTASGRQVKRKALRDVDFTDDFELSGDEDELTTAAATAPVVTEDDGALDFERQLEAAVAGDPSAPDEDSSKAPQAETGGGSSAKTKRPPPKKKRKKRQDDDDESYSEGEEDRKGGREDGDFDLPAGSDTFTWAGTRKKKHKKKVKPDQDGELKPKQKKKRNSGIAPSGGRVRKPTSQKKKKKPFMSTSPIRAAGATPAPAPSASVPVASESDPAVSNAEATADKAKKTKPRDPSGTAVHGRLRKALGFAQKPARSTLF